MRYAIVIGIILVALPLVLRAHTAEPFPDAQSYEHLRTAELDSYDALYAQPYRSGIDDILFGSFNAQAILIILAALTLFVLALYYDDEVFLLLFATSPAFLATFTTVGETAIGALIIALGALLIKHEQYWAVFAVPLAFALSFPLGILCAITCIAVALVTDKPFVALGASFFSLVSGTVSLIIAPERTLGLTVPGPNDILGIFAGAQGVTIFLLFLGFVGFIMTWREKQATRQLAVILIIPCALFFEHGAILLAALFAFYGSRAWSFLTERNWHFEELRSITLLLIISGALFTAIVVEKERSTLNEPRVEATQFLVAAYPKGTQVYAGDDIAPVLAYHGYPSSAVSFPSNPSFIASALRERGYELIVTTAAHPPYDHFPLLYHDPEVGGYTIYEIPDYS